MTIRITGSRRSVLFFLLVATSVGAGPRARPPERLRSEIDALADRAILEKRTAGLSIAVTGRGAILAARGYGLADLENHVPARANTVYPIASITKQFTAAAILRLAEAGELSLEDGIERFLPDYPLHGQRVLIRQLLNHTAGIRNLTSLGAKYWSQIGRDASTEEILGIFENEPLDFTPGERYAYSNSGYFLLGLIVEKASRLSYGEYLSRDVFPRAGLEHTVYCGSNALLPRRARGYSLKEGSFVNARHVGLTQGFSMGGICSTAPDLARWEEALASGRVVGAASWRQMTTAGSLPDGRPLSSGYGTGVGNFAGHRVLYHAGGIFGADSMETYYPDDGLAVVVLSNTDGDLAGELENQIARRALKTPPLREHPLSAAERGACVGTYRSGGLTLSVRETKGRLLLELPDSPPWRLIYQGEGAFAMKDRPQRVVFDLRDGVCRELRITHYGAERVRAEREGANQ